MAISWGVIKSVGLFFGPMLLPKAIAFYRSVRAAPSSHKTPIRPIPSNVSRALAILFLTASLFLISTLPIFAPENVFSLTSSRLQIPVDVLFTRLSALRPAGLTPSDEILRTKIVSMESRLLYFQFGPDVITNCPACNADDPKSYLYFALTASLGYHLFNLCVLGLVTSGLFTGKEASTWRTTATLGAAAVAFAEIYLLSSYNHQGNARATRLEDIDTFFWSMRVYRGVLIAALDGVIGWLLYLSSTNRAFVKPRSTAERIETATRLLEVARSKMSAMGIVRNTINRDEELRSRSQGYWIHEGKLMSELMEEREVIEGVNNALEGRINLPSITADAEAYASNVVGPLEAMPGMNGATQ